MDRRTVLKGIGTLAGATALSVPLSNSETKPPPAGTSHKLGHNLVNIGTYDLLTTDELGDLLRAIETEADGTVTVNVLEETVEGRPIYSASVGSGDIPVVGIMEQHGDEPFQAEGGIAVLEFLGTNHHGSVKNIRENITLHIVPRVNPDGFAARTRVTRDPTVPEGSPRIGFHTSENKGWDPNRYHWNEWEMSPLFLNHPEQFPENPVPEVASVTTFIETIDPYWVIDFHRQDPHVDSNGNIIDISLAWPLHADVPRSALLLSHQMVALLYDRLPKIEPCNITEFSAADDYPGKARNAYGIDGRGSILFEMSTATRGGIGYRIQMNAEALLLLVEATADGSLQEVDPSLVSDLPDEWGTTLKV